RPDGVATIDWKESQPPSPAAQRWRGQLPPRHRAAEHQDWRENQDGATEIPAKDRWNSIGVAQPRNHGCDGEPQQQREESKHHGGFGESHWRSDGCRIAGCPTRSVRVRHRLGSLLSRLILALRGAKWWIFRRGPPQSPTTLFRPTCTWPGCRR